MQARIARLDLDDDERDPVRGGEMGARAVRAVDDMVSAFSAEELEDLTSAGLVPTRNDL